MPTRAPARSRVGARPVLVRRLRYDVLARWKDLCLDAHDQQLLGEFWVAAIGLGTERSPGKLSLEADRPERRICAFLRDPATPRYPLHGVVIDCRDPEAQAVRWGRVRPPSHRLPGW